MESQELILEQLSAINKHLGINGDSSPLARRVTMKREVSNFLDGDGDEEDAL